KDHRGRSLAFFRTADGKITSFHRGADSGASEVNRRGDILGWITTNSTSKGFVLSPGGAYRILDGAIPSDLNNARFVTGEVPSQPPLMCSSSFIWAPDGTLTEFSPSQKSCISGGNCINQEGLVAGYYGGIGGGHAYTRSAEGVIRTFDPLGSTE